MAESSDTPSSLTGRLSRWLLKDRVVESKGRAAKEGPKQHSWWQVACLTGVDYFSTLGYIPAIAGLAAGALSPIATLLIVLLTLFGMLPMYRRVAAESPHGQGSIAMLERLLSFWKGKVLVLCLLGFVAVAWLATITLSSSDATAHIIENPLVPEFLHGHEVVITLVLLALLGAVFLKGFKEAIGIAVFLVATFLLLTLVVVAVGLYEIVTQPQNLVDWQSALFINYGSPLAMLGFSLLVFPQLALGLSGFETGVSMMPLVRGGDEDDPDRPAVRIRNTGKMLTTAALIMSFYLLTTTFVTAVLIPAEEFESGGDASGRAIAYVAHEYLGSVFGTIYDLSTIMILWFAGASAMAGLLNIVPRYLPRYGMAPEWAKALRPLVLVFTAAAIAITIIFKADVDAQAGAYATGVLAMMTSGAAAVTITAWRGGSKRGAFAFGLVTTVFVYALVANEIQRPDGLIIASVFVVTIVVTSLLSRVWRTTELRTERIELDEEAQRFIDEGSDSAHIHLIAHRAGGGDEHEYARKVKEQREENHVPEDVPILFLEVDVKDPSEFQNVLEVRGVEVGGYQILRAESTTVPNSIAALLLHLRDTAGKEPHCYFGWTEGNPLVSLFRYLLLGEGDTAPVTHEVLREAEPDSERRPAIHVGGK
ncbi:MAG TPA: amino acid transporter [Rubrobacteraceae bacterium]|nr:amino acid transporter [Rubrobacteraceae bacterium]